MVASVEPALRYLVPMKLFQDLVGFQGARLLFEPPKNFLFVSCRRMMIHRDMLNRSTISTCVRVHEGENTLFRGLNHNARKAAGSPPLS